MIDAEEGIEKRECSCMVGGNANCVQMLRRRVWRFLKKINIELPYNPAASPWGIHLKETKSLSEKDICTSMFFAALFTTVKIRKQSVSPDK